MSTFCVNAHDLVLSPDSLINEFMQQGYPKYCGNEYVYCCLTKGQMKSQGFVMDS